VFRLPKSGWSRDLLGQPQARGFMWGAGTAMAAYFIWPAVKEAIRPATKGVVRGAMAAGDRFRSAMAGAREGVEDLVAEAQFERMRDGFADQVEDSGHAIAEAIRPDPPNPKRTTKVG
jgi:hypothetical protein